MDFTKYFTMKEKDAARYAAEKLDFIFSPGDDLECKEIGDGNLNYIFRVWRKSDGASIVIKQSGPVARISDEFKVSPDRNRIEYDILKYQGELVPGLVPKVYLYDPIMNCTVMDDLSDHTIMRTAMLEHRQFPRFAEDITTFMANTLILTTDLCLDHKHKKELVKNFINPELCEITEDLVYTEPFNDVNNRNRVFEPNRQWIEENVYGDEALRLETAKLKFEFMTNAQSLVHGDLHTGSIFIKEDSMKVIDPEFAFYGPMGFDIGNIVANLMFAWANADAYEVSKQKEWLEETIVAVVDLFKEKYNVLFDENVTEVTARYKGFKEYYLDRILSDTAGVAGLEGSRRNISIAQVKDITTIEDEAKRIRAERICLTAAKKFIMNRDEFKTGKDFLDVILKTAEQF